MKKKSKKSSKKKKPPKESHLEEKFHYTWNAHYPKHRPIREYYFHPKRKFRFDFAWPTRKIAVEVQGYGVGHNSLPGMTQDYDKHMYALLLGWRVIFLTSRHLEVKRINKTLKVIATLLNIQDSKEPVGYIPLRNRQ